MLDDLKKIHERDAGDTLGFAAKEWQQLGHDFAVTPELSAAPISHIVYAAMGGSAVAALLLQAWSVLAKPLAIVRDYDIPAYVGAETLFIACSHSGNTEETLAALDQAVARGAHIAVITGGGRLADIARERGYPLVLLPPTAQPRFTAFSNLKALVTLLQQAGILTSAAAALAEQAESLRTAADAWLPTVPAKDNLAKQIALECMGKSVVISSGSQLSAVAYKWKLGFNESAKQVAWVSQLPEANHNELTGWSKQPEHKPYAVVELRSSFEHPRVQRRFAVTERLLSGVRPSPVTVQAVGETLLEQQLWMVVLGDFVGVYTGIVHGVDPGSLELVDKFKKALTE